MYFTHRQSNRENQRKSGSLHTRIIEFAKADTGDVADVVERVYKQREKMRKAKVLTKEMAKGVLDIGEGYIYIQKIEKEE